MFIVVDVEATGPIPNLYSMTEFGAVAILPDLSFKTFYTKVDLIPEARFNPSSLEAIGTTIADLKYRTPRPPSPGETMEDFAQWITQIAVHNKKFRPTMISDNIAFDWSWINYYFHFYIGSNPLGYSGRRIGDIFAGIEKNLYKSWKHLRVTKHDHNPLHDAMANAEALVAMTTAAGIKLYER